MTKILANDCNTFIEFYSNNCHIRIKFMLISFSTNKILGTCGAAYYLHSDRVRLHIQPDDQHVCRMFASRTERTVLVCIKFSVQTLLPVIVMGVLYYLIVKVMLHFFWYQFPPRRVRAWENKGKSDVLTVCQLD